MKSTNNPLTATSLLDGFETKEATQTYHSETQEPYFELALNEEKTTLVSIFEDGTTILRRGDTVISLDNVEAMKFANVILTHSRLKKGGATNV